jgi:hypothetical protein
MLQEKVKYKVLEYCNSLYQNPWFLVQKKSGKYRLVNATIKLNKHTIQDANLLLSVDKFSEEFASC